MLGSRDNPNFAAKGSETRNVLPFLLSVFDEYGEHFSTIRKDNLRLALGFAKEASIAASEFEEILRSQPRKMSTDATVDLMSKYMRFLSMYARAGGNIVQKHHLMVHCVQESKRFGNPRFYTTYRSESFNGVLAKMARVCHSSVFYADVHLRAAALNARSLSKHMV